MSLDLAPLHAALIEAVQAGGERAMADYVPGGQTRARVEWKAGGSPVTSADLAVDEMLRARLADSHPAIRWHSEEDPDSWRGRDALPLAFVIDPIDGTRDFVNGGQDWCISLGVLVEGKPVAGAIHLPARGETVSAYAGGGAWRNGQRLAPRSLAQPPGVNGPKPAFEAFCARHGVEMRHLGSTPALAHRLLAPATGAADVALARAGGHDWDIVAASAILHEIGAAVLTVSGECVKFDLAGGEHAPLMAASLILFDNIRAFDLTDRA